MTNTPAHPDTLSRGSYSNSRRVADILRAESVGGIILLIATVLARSSQHPRIHPLLRSA